MAHAENQVNGGLDAWMGSREVDGVDSHRTGHGENLQPERELLCWLCSRLPADGSVD